MSVPPNVPRGSYGPKGPLPPSFPWGGMMQGPPMIPKLYWDAYSDEQRIKELWRCFDLIADRVNQLGYYYVPDFEGTWSGTREYPPLSVVEAPEGIEGVTAGDSYTALDWVPAGTPLTDERYWAKTGNYNAQIESIKEYVDGIESDVTNLTEDITAETQRATAAEKELEDKLTSEVSRATAAESGLQTAVNGKAPIMHASPDSTYGLATTELYGHVKLADSVDDAAEGMVVTPPLLRSRLSLLPKTARVVPTYEGVLRVMTYDGIQSASFSPNPIYWCQGLSVTDNGFALAVVNSAQSGRNDGVIYTRGLANSSTWDESQSSNVISSCGHMSSLVWIDSLSRYLTTGSSEASEICIVNPSEWVIERRVVISGMPTNSTVLLAYDKSTGKLYGSPYGEGLYEIDYQTFTATEIAAWGDVNLSNVNVLQDIAVGDGALYALYSSGNSIAKFDLSSGAFLCMYQLGNDNSMYYVGETEGIDYYDGRLYFSSAYHAMGNSVFYNRLWSLSENAVSNYDYYPYMQNIGYSCSVRANSAANRVAFQTADAAIWPTIQEALDYATINDNVSRINLQGYHRAESVYVFNDTAFFLANDPDTQGAASFGDTHVYGCSCVFNGTGTCSPLKKNLQYYIEGLADNGIELANTVDFYTVDAGAPTSGYYIRSTWGDVIQYGSHTSNGFS